MNGRRALNWLAGVFVFGGLLFSPCLALADYTITTTGSASEITAVGGGGAWDGGTGGDAWAQRFTTLGSGTTGAVTVSLTYRLSEGTPTNEITYKIYADNGSGTAPTGTALTTLTSGITPFGVLPDNSCTDVAKTFTAVSLAGATNYWLVATKDNSDGNVYYICGNSSSGSDYGYLRSGSFNNFAPGTIRAVISITEGGGGGGGGGGGATTTGPMDGTTTPLTYQEDLFLWGVMIFFVSLISWRVIFGPFISL